jgi:hypothetical protein
MQRRKFSLRVSLLKTINLLRQPREESVRNLAMPPGIGMIVMLKEVSFPQE